VELSFFIDSEPVEMEILLPVFSGFVGLFEETRLGERLENLGDGASLFCVVCSLTDAPRDRPNWILDSAGYSKIGVRVGLK
jgi:hypothetical protein